MTYDNTDTNADGAIDAPIDNESVSTEKASIGTNARDWGDTIHFYAVGGQSNAEGKGDPDSGVPSPDVSSDVAIQYNPSDDSISSPLDDPVSQDNYESAWPAFVERYYQLTGIKVCIVESAEDGSAQTAAADSGFGNWSSSGLLRGRLKTHVNDGMTKLKAEGYNPVFKGVLWSQGEADGDAIGNSTITQSEYGTAFADMVDDYHANLPDEPVVWVFQTGVPESSTPPGYRKVRQEQLNQISQKSAARLASEIQQTFPYDGKMRTGEVHYNTKGLNAMGQAGAESVVNGYGRDGPEYEVQAVMSSDQTIEGTAEIVGFDGISGDGNKLGQFDTSTAKYQCVADGYYEVYARVEWTNAIPDGTRYRLDVRRERDSNISVIDRKFGIAGGSDFLGHDIYTRDSFYAGDYIRIHVQHNDGSSQTLNGNAESSAFNVKRAGPLNI